VLSEARVPFNYVGTPQDRTQVLRRATNRCCCSCTTVVTIAKDILTLTEIDDFNLAIWQKEQIGWLQISMTKAYRL